MATASTMSSSWIRASTITAISVGAVVTGVLGYAIYFDHRRRTDPEFRKALKRESRKQEKAAKLEAQAESSRQRRAIREAVDKVSQEDLPTDPEEVEKFFMEQVAEGEILCQDCKSSIWTALEQCTNSVPASKFMDAALCFFRALKVYPQQEDLISIYDKTVPKVCYSIYLSLHSC